MFSFFTKAVLMYTVFNIPHQGKRKNKKNLDFDCVSKLHFQIFFMQLYIWIGPGFSL